MTSAQDQYLEVTTPVPAAAVLFGAGKHISATGWGLTLICNTRAGPVP